MRLSTEALVLEFGGASGTLAALAEKGGEVARLLGEELGLAVPDAPWHTHRDRLAAVVADCGIYTATLGKIARDATLLMQQEVGEAEEAGGGGSSAMPHKRNPTSFAIVLACANRTPGLVADFLAGMVQEHERGVGGPACGMDDDLERGGGYRIRAFRNGPRSWIIWWCIPNGWRRTSARRRAWCSPSER